MPPNKPDPPKSSCRHGAERPVLGKPWLGTMGYERWGLVGVTSASAWEFFGVLDDPADRPKYLAHGPGTLISAVAARSHRRRVENRVWSTASPSRLSESSATGWSSLPETVENRSAGCGSTSCRGVESRPLPNACGPASPTRPMTRWMSFWVNTRDGSLKRRVSITSISRERSTSSSAFATPARPPAAPSLWKEAPGVPFGKFHALSRPLFAPGGVAFPQETPGIPASMRLARAENDIAK